MPNWTNLIGFLIVAILLLVFIVLAINALDGRP